MTHYRAITLTLLTSVVLAGCPADEVSEIIVLVDTDFAVPDALNRIEIRVDATDIGGQANDHAAELTGASAVALPVSLGVVHGGGPLGPLRVRATGHLDDSEVIRRDAEVFFVKGQIRVLRILLERACLGVECSEGQTCEAGGCRSVTVTPGELETYAGDLGRPDGSLPCEAKGETCNGMDDDCDGVADEDFDLATDQNNCGDCEAVCPAMPPNAIEGACIAGVCEILCDDGQFDCNGRGDDGCESALREDEHCGACGAPCAFPAAMTSCDSGVCEVVGCNPNVHDCDGLPDNGCESRLRDNENCGVCGVPCELPNAVESCGSGSCIIVSCETPFDNCDGRADNGCEVDTQADLMHCGRCGMRCPADPPNASTTCDAGTCGIACDPGWADCDMDARNGCEVDLSHPMTCGDCTTACPMGTPLCSGNPVGGWTCRRSCPGGMPTDCGSSCVDTNRNPVHCGTCGNACAARPNAAPTCSAGVCGLTCDPGFGDCDGNAMNGCETSLDTLSDCGSCGSACAAPGAAVLRCDMGACVIDSCMPGRDDCDGMLSNGCEATLTTLANCGSCGATCTRVNATATCGTGTCLLGSCTTGFGDCDGMDANGCEVNLSDPAHCGSCTNVCPTRPRSSPTCAGGACGFSCDPGFGDCNGIGFDGCETDVTSSRTHCGACGMGCSSSGPNVDRVDCASSACTITDCTDAWEDCNGVFADGCEIDTDRDDDNCGRCGRVCSSGESCNEGSCDS